MIKSIPLLLAIAGLAYGFDPVIFQTHYIHLGQHDKSVAMASDSAGNIFIVSSLTDLNGPAGIRATKADHQGNFVASFDFDIGYQGVPTSAAVNPRGELLIGGYSQSGLGQFDAHKASFVVRLDSGLTHILSSAALGDVNTGGTRILAVAVDGQGNVRHR